MPGQTSIGTENEGGNIPLESKPEPLPRHPVRINRHRLERIMSYVLSLVVAATVLGATQASSEEVGLGVSVRWVDDRVMVGATLDVTVENERNTASLKK